MRIISGEAKGRKLKTVPGEETRPTSDRMKESMFNILQFRLEGRRVLDLYAGTGQLGAEALSRGAQECVFVDQLGTAAAVIKENTRIFGGRAVVRIDEVLRFLESERTEFDVVLLDPPYRSPLVHKTLKRLFERDMLRPGGCILCECDAGNPSAGAVPPYAMTKEYVYGAKKLVLYERGTE